MASADNQSSRLDVLSNAADHAQSNSSRKRTYTTISNEKRALIMNAIDSLGMPVTEAAKHFQVSRTAISNIKRIFYAEGYRTDKKITRGKKVPILTATEICIIQQWLDNNALLTLPQIRRACLEQFNKNVSESTLSRAIGSFHYSLKRVSFIPERASSEEIVQARHNYATLYLTIMSMREPMYFLDETGFCVSMRRRVGRSRIGTRAVAHVPALRTKNFSICAAYNINSLFAFRIENRPYNTNSYLGFVKDMLDEFASRSICGAILIMDNVAFHHSRSVADLIANAGHRLVFLPAYSPFLNPIENVFNQWKHKVKTLEPTSESELLLAIDSSAGDVSQTNCRNYFNKMETYIPRCLNYEEIDG